MITSLGSLNCYNFDHVNTEHTIKSIKICKSKYLHKMKWQSRTEQNNTHLRPFAATKIKFMEIYNDGNTCRITLNTQEL